MAPDISLFCLLTFQYPITLHFLCFMFFPNASQRKQEAPRAAVSLLSWVIFCEAHEVFCHWVFASIRKGLQSPLNQADRVAFDTTLLFVTLDWGSGAPQHLELTLGVSSPVLANFEKENLKVWSVFRSGFTTAPEISFFLIFLYFLFFVSSEGLWFAVVLSGSPWD